MGPIATPTNTPTATPVVAPPTYDETYAYDLLGNLTSKAGVSYTYGPNGSGPHQARNVGGTIYSYDANGNLTSGGRRTFTWNADNLPTSVTSGGVTENYVYDADGERVAKTVNGTTTVYFQGLWEQTVGGASKRYYTFNGQVVAVRDSATNSVTYLHGDHLGSVALATNSSGQAVSRQDFDPWGKARGTSTIGQTSLNYTGQRLDGTGLLYYHARYYDPALARFVSADSIVPGQRDTVGTANPQSLNRYSYVNNNPIRYTDPSGHCFWDLCLVEGAGAYAALTFVFTAATYVGIQIYNIQHPINTDPSPDNSAVPAPSSDPDNGSIDNGPTTTDGLGTGTPVKPAQGVTGYAPDRELPRKAGGEPAPDTPYPHTQLGVKTSKRTGQTYRQTREWDENGKPVKDTDWTDHGRPREHTNPHDHPYVPSRTGGTPRRS